jgi:pyruvate/2-oxoglutarate/acetoin dehydrogenase E1 component
MLHREVNAQFTDEAIVLYPTANVGLAVAAPQGLVVPVIRGAERLTLAEIAAVVGEQAFDWLDAPVERVGAKFAPLPFAPVMEEYVVPHAGDVLEAIKRTVARG